MVCRPRRSSNWTPSSGKNDFDRFSEVQRSHRLRSPYPRPYFLSTTVPPGNCTGFAEVLESYGVSLYWHAQATERLLPSGKRNPAAGIMLAVLAEMVRAETETLRERINSGLAEARRKGVTMGRSKGSGITTRAFLTKHRDVAKLLREGQSIRNVAKITGKGISTVQRVKAVG